MNQDDFILYGQRLQSRLLLGTSRYPSPAVLARAIERSRPGMLTASLRRQTAGGESHSGFWSRMGYEVNDSTPIVLVYFDLL